MLATADVALHGAEPARARHRCPRARARRGAARRAGRCYAAALPRAAIGAIIYFIYTTYVDLATSS